MTTTPLLRVLQVEDSPTDAKLVLMKLRSIGRPIEATRVQDAAALEAALAVRWDLILCDWSMPSFDALAALTIVKRLGIDVPFLIVSGTVGEEHAVAAMRIGAHDYVLKDDLSRLAPAVEREMADCAVRQAHRAAERAAQAALHERVQLAELTAEVAFELAKGDDLALTLQRCLESFVDHLGGGAARVWSFDPIAQALVLRASAGDAALDVTPRFTDPLATDLRLDPPPGHEVAAYPLVFGSELMGVLAMLSPDPIRSAARDGVATIAGGLAIVMHRDVVQQMNVGLEAQLRQAQKMEAVGRLAGGIAHDFNNLLSVVLSYSHLLLDQLGPAAEARSIVEEIREAGQRAATLTRQLLMFSRQNVMAPRVLDLDALLGEMSTMLARVVGEDVTVIFTRGAVAVDPIRVDRGGVEQILMNLVVNARDAMPTGGRLTLETSNVVLDETYTRAHVGAKAGPHVRLRVTDDGTGMSAEVQAKVFEPFFTTKDAVHGTGLGLSTVLGIVQQNNGSVWVESEVGRGTSFNVYFPRDQGARDARHTPAPSKPVVTGTETILLVEDADGVRAVARRILVRAGYHVLAASGGVEALALFAEHPGTIALLLTDVVMPGMSGPELAKRLLGQRADLKVLCMSGYTDDSIVRHGVLSAELAFLPKPFTPVSLASKVREVLDA